LAQNALRSTESVAETLHMNSIRQVEERQILRGQYTGGWNGLKDEGSELVAKDFSTDIDWLSTLRELITEVEYNGGDPGSIAVFVDFDAHADIRKDLQDFIRYDTPGEELGFGFKTLNFEGTQVLKTHGIPRYSGGTSDGDAKVIAADMSSVYMGMLQDITVKPLAKVGPQEQFATDAYGTLVTEAPSKIQYVGAKGNVS